VGVAAGKPGFIDHFWSRVDVRGPDECWTWSRGGNKRGYGTVRMKRGVISAHRLAYMLTHGEIPADLCVCHTCDNPLCCNPAHLWVGTQLDNVADMVAKGRGLGRGEASHRAKLREPEVLEIRRKYKRGHVGYGRLAEEYGVKPATIAEIIKRKTWSHI
jgi:hypothetical protein